MAFTRYDVFTEMTTNNEPFHQYGRSIAIDGAGRIYVVGSWTFPPSVWISWSDDKGLSWSHEQIYTSTSSTWKRAPKIAISGGTVYIAWTLMGSYDDIYYTYGTPFSWETPIRVNTSTSHLNSYHSIAVSNNEVHFVWKQYNLSTYVHSLKYRKDVGGVLTTEEEVVSPVGSTTRADIGADSLFAPHIIYNYGNSIRYTWKDFSLPGADYYVWETPTVIASKSYPQIVGAMTVDTDDNIHATFHGRGWKSIGYEDVLYMRKAAWGAWGSAKYTSTTLAQDEKNPQVSVDDNGLIAVAWCYDPSGANERYLIRYSKNEGDTWYPMAGPEILRNQASLGRYAQLLAIPEVNKVYMAAGSNTSAMVEYYDITPPDEVLADVVTGYGYFM